MPTVRIFSFSSTEIILEMNFSTNIRIVIFSNKVFPNHLTNYLNCLTCSFVVNAENEIPQSKFSYFENSWIELDVFLYVYISAINILSTFWNNSLDSTYTSLYHTWGNALYYSEVHITSTYVTKNALKEAVNHQIMWY